MKRVTAEVRGARLVLNKFSEVFRLLPHGGTTRSIEHCYWSNLPRCTNTWNINTKMYVRFIPQTDRLRCLSLLLGESPLLLCDQGVNRVARSQLQLSEEILSWRFRQSSALSGEPANNKEAGCCKIYFDRKKLVCSSLPSGGHLGPTWSGSPGHLLPPNPTPPPPSPTNLGFHTDDAGQKRTGPSFFTLTIGCHVKFDTRVKNSDVALSVKIPTRSERVLRPVLCPRHKIFILCFVTHGQVSPCVSQSVGLAVVVSTPVCPTHRAKNLPPPPGKLAPHCA